ncbi:uncharacterized protein JCM15063_005773 [Sporobolomyces koalae]|uniref:uncharacterized protein n=1 Tax=Sporobolomyces koalae TaxID=500713 RepID=UPI00317C7464
MQGPRLSSHYDRNVPDLTLHLAPPVKSTPPSRSRPPTPDSAAIDQADNSWDSCTIDADDPIVAQPNRERSAVVERSESLGAAQDEPSNRVLDDDNDIKDDTEAVFGKRSDRTANPGTRARDDEEDYDGSNNKRSFKQRAWKAIKRHSAFVGPGVVASIAYLDPGNWSTDLQAGSAYGYSHLFIVLLSGLMALFFQILATRLGCVSDEDFATHCRIALHNRDSKYKLFYRWGVLYPLYVLSEAGIVFTDLAELLGSAIAINLLIPAIPLWGCVLITAGDVLLILLLFNQYPTRTVSRSMRLFELLLGLLVLVVLASFVALLVEVKPVWKDAFHGYIPSSGIVDNGGIYIAVGIIGATVMPHAFFIGSKMACMRRIPPSAYGEEDEERVEDDAYYVSKDADEDAISVESGERRRTYFIPSLHLPQPFRLNQRGFEFMSNPRIPMDDLAPTEESTTRKGLKSDKKPSPPELERPKPSYACVKAHLSHACFDVAGSLLGFALVVNSAILILAAAVFYYGEGKSSSTRGEGISDLFDAYDLVKQYLGQALAYIFAIALLAAGQSASLTVTLAGQIIGEGFIRWRTKPWKRRLITRLIGIIPSLAVSIGVGRQGINTLLVASQVALSIVLTFVLPPLIIFTSSMRVMGLPDKSYVAPSTAAEPNSPPKRRSYRARLRSLLKTLNPIRQRRLPPGVLVSYASPPVVVYLCWMIWLLISTANVYALYTLSHGEA